MLKLKKKLAEFPADPDLVDHYFRHLDNRTTPNPYGRAFRYFFLNYINGYVPEVYPNEPDEIPPVPPPSLPPAPDPYFCMIVGNPPPPPY